MELRGALLLIAAAATALGACQGSGCARRGGEGATSPAAGAAPAAPVAPLELGGEGPGGEMVPGLALPPGTSKPDQRRPGSAAPDPARVDDQEQLLAAARQALDEGRPADALAIIDVLVVLDPEDPEVLELRAGTLDQTGDREGAAADRERCCKLGRRSCCR